MANVEWQEVVATTFGVPSPALKPHVGKPIMGTRSLVDPYGLVFFNDPALCSKGGARQRWHDNIVREIFSALKEGGIISDREVEGLFRDLIPLGNRAAYLRSYPSSKRREGLVPDLRFCRLLVYFLADVKTLGFGKTRYGPPGRSLGRQPPDTRADKVHEEYLAKAKALDRKWCGTPLGQGVKGPIEQRLGSFGRVAGLVFGFFGEMSKDASDILSFAAGEIAARSWEKESSSTSLDAASVVMKRRLTHNWGVTSAREVARIKLEGRRWLSNVGGNPRAGTYALMRADRCARDRNLAYANNANGRVGCSWARRAPEPLQVRLDPETLASGPFVPGPGPDGR